jgi:nicotinate phosphoribosyltransferase
MPLAALRAEVERELDHLCSLSFRADELAYLSGLRFIKSDFVDFLRIFRFQRDFIRVREVGDDLEIVARGPQVHVMAFEIFVLAIVNELYFRRFDADAARAEGRRRLSAKIGQLRDFEREPPRRHPFEMFDFGLRRRYSRSTGSARWSTPSGAKCPNFSRARPTCGWPGTWAWCRSAPWRTSTCRASRRSAVRLRDSQKAALESWVQEYRGDLGTALTDVIGMDAFLADFDLYFAKLFDGLRHDSGDPVLWGEKALAHYERLRVDAHTKRLVFSDGLDITTALRDLYRHFADRTQLGFGIGTHLSNDMGLVPLHIVMKLTRVNGQPVAKLSDSPGKTMCDDATFLAYLRQVFNHPLETP